MKPKICLITPGILPVPAVKGGAIETLVQILAEENEKYQSVNLYIVSVYDHAAKQKSESYKYSSFVYINKNIFEKIIHFFMLVIRKAAYILFNNKRIIYDVYYAKCFKIVKKENPHFIVMEGGDYQKINFLIRYFKKEQLFIHIHEHYMPGEKSLHNNIGGVIGVSKFVTKEYMKFAKNPTIKPYTVMNCINDELFGKQIMQKERETLKLKLGFNDADFIVLFCGRIAEEKGVHEIIQAMIQIPNSNIKLLIIGSSHFALHKKTRYLIKIEKLIRRLNNRIVFTGYINNDSLHKYYQIADIMVVPSLIEEAFSLVTLEGLTSGLPLIVTNSGGIPELVSSESAIIIERDQYLVDNLAVNIENLYNNENKRRSMADTAVKESVKFSRNRFYQDFVSIFKNEDAI